jgi:hypothetical protein
VQGERKSKFACIFPSRRLISALRSEAKISEKASEKASLLAFFRAAA